MFFLENKNKLQFPPPFSKSEGGGVGSYEYAPGLILHFSVSFTSLISMRYGTSRKFCPISCSDLLYTIRQDFMDSIKRAILMI